MSLDHNSFCKSLVQTGLTKIEFPCPHYIISRQQYLVVVDGNGNPVNLDIKTNFMYPEYLVPRNIEMAKIRHYPTMTLNEFIRKQYNCNYVCDGLPFECKSIEYKFWGYCNKTQEKLDYIASHIQ